MKLIIVETPNKIKKIKVYAGPDYEVGASVGHIRDLPVGGGDICIDREHGHALKYVISDDKKAVVANQCHLAKAAGLQGVYHRPQRVGPLRRRWGGKS
jgi:DNA topoisomerase-1